MTDTEILQLISDSLRPLNNRVNNLIRLAQLVSRKDGNTQFGQFLTANEEIADNVQIIEPYGLTGKAPLNSEAVIGNIQGNPNNTFVFVLGSRQFRFKELKDGEVALYDDSGNILHFKNGGNIDLIAPAQVNITAETAAITAQTTTINGKVNLAGGGAGIARLGDTVEVDPNTHKGTITSASTEATSA